MQFYSARRYRTCLSCPKVIKLFSYSTQLSMKFSLLINMKMPTIENANNSWHFPIFSGENLFQNQFSIVTYLRFISMTNFMLS